MVNKLPARLTENLTSPAGGVRNAARQAPTASPSPLPGPLDLPTGFEPGTSVRAAAFTRAASSPAGDFTVASPEKEQALRDLYLASLSAGLTRPPAGKVSRVGPSDLAVDLNALSDSEATQLRALGHEKLRSAYLFTSGAGLWSRGGGQVKALVPLNLVELLTPRELQTLADANDLFNAKSPADVLFMSKVPVKEGEKLEDVSARVVREAQASVDDIFTRARANPRALPPLALKFIQVALASQRAGTYIPFDVGTSEQTHAAITDYVRDFQSRFASMQFHPDPAVQDAIVGALREYFARSALMRETHVFGKQEGYPALDPKTGAPLPQTARIGEGAGRAKAYLDETGRTGELQRRSKDTWMFSNIEVFPDLASVFGAHAQAAKPVSVVVVPQREGYAGGNLFRVEKPDGTSNYELHEQSALPKEFAEGNAYFNSNTILQPLSAKPPSSIGFEMKNNNTQARAKQNAGDITQELPTAGTSGRIGIEYENLKTYPEYEANGLRLIDSLRSLWAGDAAPTPA